MIPCGWRTKSPLLAGTKLSSLPMTAHEKEQLAELESLDAGQLEALGPEQLQRARAVMLRMLQISLECGAASL